MTEKRECNPAVYSHIFEAAKGTLFVDKGALYNLL